MNRMNDKNIRNRHTINRISNKSVKEENINEDINEKFNWDKFQDNFMKHNSYKDVIKYTLNEKNTEITGNHVLNKLREYDLDYDDYEKINDLKLYKIATTHVSYTKEYQPKNESDKNFKKLFMNINYMNGEKLNPIDSKDINSAIKLKEISYERLEFIGDSVIRLILSLYLSMRFFKKREGFLTKSRAELENALTLSLLAKKLELNKYVLISRNNEISGARDVNQKMQCDLFEAFIGALFLDICKIKHDDIDGKIEDIFNLIINSGKAFLVCKKFIINILEKEVNIPKLLRDNVNYKDSLVQGFHKLNWKDPKYGLKKKIEDTTNMGKQYFHMYVRGGEGGEIIGEGLGTSKQKGEKKAAKNAFIALKKQYPDLIEDSIDDDRDEKDIILKSNDSIINKNNKYLII